MPEVGGPTLAKPRRCTSLDLPEGSCLQHSQGVVNDSVDCVSSLRLGKENRLPRPQQRHDHRETEGNRGRGEDGAMCGQHRYIGLPSNQAPRQPPRPSTRGRRGGRPLSLSPQRSAVPNAGESSSASLPRAPPLLDACGDFATPESRSHVLVGIRGGAGQLPLRLPAELEAAEFRRTGRSCGSGGHGSWEAKKSVPPELLAPPALGRDSAGPMQAPSACASLLPAGGVLASVGVEVTSNSFDVQRPDAAPVSAMRTSVVAHETLTRKLYEKFGLCDCVSFEEFASLQAQHLHDGGTVLESEC